MVAADSRISVSDSGLITQLGCPLELLLLVPRTSRRFLGSGRASANGWLRGDTVFSFMYQATSGLSEAPHVCYYRYPIQSMDAGIYIGIIQ